MESKLRALIDPSLVAISKARQEGKVAGLTMALRMAKASPRGRKGQEALTNYLESQLDLAKKVPF